MIHPQPTVFFGITLNPSRVSRILRRKLIDLLICWTNHLHQGPFTYWPQEELNTATCPDNHTQAAESYRVGLFWSVISQFVVPKSVKLRKTSTFVPFLRFDPRTKSFSKCSSIVFTFFYFLLLSYCRHYSTSFVTRSSRVGAMRLVTGVSKRVTSSGPLRVTFDGAAALLCCSAGLHAQLLRRQRLPCGCGGGAHHECKNNGHHKNSQNISQRIRMI